MSAFKFILLVLSTPTASLGIKAQIFPTANSFILLNHLLTVSSEGSTGYSHSEVCIHVQTGEVLRLPNVTLGSYGARVDPA